MVIRTSKPKPEPSLGALELATNRNTHRLLVADEQDSEVLRKYLNGDVLVFLPAPVVGPDDNHEPPHTFLHKLQTVAATPVPTPSAPCDYTDLIQ